MNKKYELLKDKTITVLDRKLFRIRALVSFADVKVGDEGGYIESENNLSFLDNAWVYGDARVYDNAQISGNARVNGHACVSGNAFVSDNAQVHDDAQVGGDAKICDNARIYDNACVYGNAQVGGDAKICDNVRIRGNARIYDNACVYGNAQVGGDAEICDNARIRGNALILNSAHFICISPIGSRNSTVTFFRTNESKIAVVAGCFYGDIDQFEEKVKLKHDCNKYGIEYTIAAQLARTHIDLS